ncbi:unnamed protein product, partial [Brachionus calyciflorus]
MTNLLQPADVCWFASIKKEYHNKWNKWFLEDERSFTRFDFSSTLIVESFSKCGIIDQFNLHSTLSYIMKTNTIIADYIDELDEGDEIDGFDTDPNIVFEIDQSDTSSQPAQNVSPSPSNNHAQPAHNENNSPIETTPQPAQNVSPSPSNNHAQPARNEAESPIVCSVRQKSQETPILLQNDK